MALRFGDIDRNAALALLARPEYRKTIATLSSKDAAKALEQFSVIVQVARETVAATNLPDVVSVQSLAANPLQRQLVKQAVLAGVGLALDRSQRQEEARILGKLESQFAASRGKTAQRIKMTPDAAQ